MTTSLFELHGRVAVVTGGYGVLGGSLAECLADCGAKVAVLGRNPEEARRKAEALRARGAEAIHLIADVCSEAQLRAALDALLRTWGRVDILVNAAGGNVPRARTDDGAVFSMPLDAFDEVVRLNLDGTVYPTLVFGEAMARGGKGSVVNISSMAAVRAISGVLGYSLAKAAIDNFTRWMAVDLARRCGPGLRVNAVAPGFFLSKQNQAVLVKPDGSPTDRATAILAHTPMGRFGDPAELQGPVLWLCSDAASFVTGTVIPVDGGFSADSGI
jgi:NAD(P)-dependent dehydrogenase (short-subunit alcohol dehydrogenase family)